MQLWYIASKTIYRPDTDLGFGKKEKGREQLDGALLEAAGPNVLHHGVVDESVRIVGSLVDDVALGLVHCLFDLRFLRGLAMGALTASRFLRDLRFSSPSPCMLWPILL